MVRHANLMSNIAIMMQRLGVGPGSATVSWLPHYHDMGLVGPILVALVSGNSANLIAPADFLRAPLSWLEAISRYRADMAIGPNFGYELCAAKLLDGGEVLDALAIDLSCLRVAVVGAEPVRAATLARFLSAAAPLGFPSQAFFPSYGLAECTLFVDGIQGTLAGTVRRFDAQALKEGKAAAGKERVLVACGMRDGESETSVVIADPDVETVLPDGSISAGLRVGPGCSHGYWGREWRQRPSSIARSRARRPLYADRRSRFYHEGKLFITGRRDDLIILNGVNHHPRISRPRRPSTHLALSAWRAAVVAVEDAGHCRVIALIEIPARRAFRSIRKADRLDPGGGVRRP
jgi:acyl-CoA synthetase (AMP-forming)/AMP-acid ligase II